VKQPAPSSSLLSSSNAPARGGPRRASRHRTQTGRGPCSPPQRASRRWKAPGRCTACPTPAGAPLAAAPPTSSATPDASSAPRRDVAAAATAPAAARSERRSARRRRHRRPPPPRGPRRPPPLPPPRRPPPRRPSRSEAEPRRPALPFLAARAAARSAPGGSACHRDGGGVCVCVCVLLRASPAPSAPPHHRATHRSSRRFFLASAEGQLLPRAWPGGAGRGGGRVWTTPTDPQRHDTTLTYASPQAHILCAITPCLYRSKHITPLYMRTYARTHTPLCARAPGRCAWPRRVQRSPARHAPPACACSAGC